MTHPIAHLRGLFGLSLLLLAGTGAVQAQMEQTDPIQAGGMILSQAADGARLELQGDRVLSVALPPRGEVESLSSLGTREWIAAGSFPDEDGRRLFLVTGDRTGSRPLPEPAGQTGAVRRNPVLLVQNGTLAGLAWLEGDGARLSIRAAAWDGRGWGTVETVSVPGPGSQAGLTGAVLADASWLLAWDRVDGEDDEIVWSQRRGETWTPVRPVSENNHVPDVTPVLTPAGSGSLLAWSRYDGEGYRLRTARFEGQTWKDERAAGPTHTMHPSFVREGDRTWLLYLNGRPRSWSVLELSASGRPLRRASALSALNERPIVSEEAGNLRLRWLSAKWETTPSWETSLEKVP